jgi:hypothetical protein
VHAILALIWNNHFTTKSSWLNPTIVTINLDSILNDVALLLVCGMLKNVSLANLTPSIFRSGVANTANNVRMVAVVPACAIDSHAYDSDREGSAPDLEASCPHVSPQSLSALNSTSLVLSPGAQMLPCGSSRSVLPLIPDDCPLYSILAVFLGSNESSANTAGQMDQKSGLPAVETIDTEMRCEAKRKAGCPIATTMTGIQEAAHTAQTTAIGDFTGGALGYMPIPAAKAHVSHTLRS